MEERWKEFGMETTEKQSEFIELRAKNYSYAKISKEINISRPTLTEWSEKFSYEIDNQKYFELEKLREQYFLMSKHRVSLFGEQLKRIKEEIEKRTFEDVPTAKLLEMEIKFTEALKKENNELDDVTFLDEAGIAMSKEWQEKMGDATML